MRAYEGMVTNMNRLIIVGNGFDLAHNFKSSYTDFIKHYLVDVLNTFYKNLKFSDVLIEITLRSRTQHINHEKITVDNVIAQFELLKSRRDLVGVKFNSTIIQASYSRVKDTKWVDIEAEYFKALYTESSRSGWDGTRKVNAELEHIKKLLIKYLKDQQKDLLQHVNSDLVNYFTDDIYEDEIVTAKLFGNIKPEKLYFLNFNYTNILNYYTEKCDRSAEDVSVNHIHGTLDGYDGEPIFGFGDEYDKKYLEFENDVKYTELVKHIKSFEYTKTKNYYDLIRFIDSGNFQVHIYGHSCGISDRTMLSQIFEHENCLSIKVFYYQKNVNENDYAEKSFEIARHFKDKKLFRKKLIPKDLSKPLPKIYN